VDIEDAITPEVGGAATDELVLVIEDFNKVDDTGDDVSVTKVVISGDVVLCEEDVESFVCKLAGVVEPDITDWSNVVFES